MVQELERIYKSSLSLPPQNIDAEESILGGILLDPNALERVVDILPIEAFYVASHQEIYRACLKLKEQGKSPDLILVVNYLTEKGKLDKIGGTPKLAQLIDRTVSAVNIDRYAELVRDKWLCRKAISAGQYISELASDPLLFSTAENNSPLTALVDKINEIGSKLTESLHSKEELEYQKYSACMEEFREIELNCQPGFREWKLGNLAGKYNKNPKFLKEVYYKSLIAKECEPSMDFDELLTKYGQDIREWYLHGLMPKGTTILLHALGGTGKTQTAYHLLYHLATGTDWGDFRVSGSQRKCLIVQTDESANDMISNLSSRGFNPEMPIRYLTRWTVDHIQSLRKEIEEFKPEIVLVDSLTTINRNSIFSENDSEYARPVLLLRDIAQEYGCTFLIVHHSSKEGSARGTTAIYNSVSEVWKLGRVKDNANPDALERTFAIEKSRSRRPASYRFEYNPNNHSWDCLGEERYLDSPSPDTKAKDSILSRLAYARGTAYAVAELQEMIGGSRDYVGRLCSSLYFDGLISRKPSNQKGGGYLYFVSNDNPENKWVDFVDCIGTDELVEVEVELAEQEPVSASGEVRRSYIENEVFPEEKNTELLENQTPIYELRPKPLEITHVQSTYNTDELDTDLQKETEEDDFYPREAYELFRSDLAKKFDLDYRYTTEVLPIGKEFKPDEEICHEILGYGTVIESSKKTIRVYWENGTESDWLNVSMFQKVTPIKFGKGISFAQTTPLLLAGKKTVTRREWKDATISTFIKYFQTGTLVPAYDKSPRNGGKVVGFIELTRKPFKQPLFEMSDEDLRMEGFEGLAVEKFANEYFVDITKEVWVIQFKFIPFSSQQNQ